MTTIFPTTTPEKINLVDDDLFLIADSESGNVSSKAKKSSVLSNIGNVNIKSGASIALNKLAATTASRALVSDGSGFISPATTTATEIGYVNGVTSAIQTQLNAKAPSTAPTFATSITGSYLTASEILGTDASKNIVSLGVSTYPSLTELAYVKGVTSAIQTQLNAKGNVSKVGTPANDQVGVWTGDGTLEGTAGLTYSGTLLTSTATTEQFRAAYDGSNYFSTTVASDGGVTFNAVGAGAEFVFSDDVSVVDARMSYDTTAKSLVFNIPA